MDGGNESGVGDIMGNMDSKWVSSQAIVLQ
jgi:hypothetical protein